MYFCRISNFDEFRPIFFFNRRKIFRWAQPKASSTYNKAASQGRVDWRESRPTLRFGIPVFPFQQKFFEAKRNSKSKIKIIKSLHISQTFLQRSTDWLKVNQSMGFWACHIEFSRRRRIRAEDFRSQ